MNRYHGKGPVQQQILRLLSDGRPRTCREIAVELGVPTGNVAGRVVSMYRHGYYPDEELLTVVGTGEFNARTYTITDRGREKMDKEEDHAESQE